MRYTLCNRLLDALPVKYRLKQTRTWRTLRYFFGAYSKPKIAFIINVTFIPLGILFGETLIGYQFGKLFEELVRFETGDNTAQLYHLGFIIIIFYLIQIAFYRVNDYVIIWRQTRGLRNLEQNIFARLPRHSYRFFSDTYGGALVSQVNRFLKACEDIDDMFFFEYLTIVARIVFSSVVLLFIAPQLGILLALWAPFFIFVLVYLSMKKAPITRAAASADSKVLAYLSDAITNMITIKTFARSQREINGFNAVSQDRYKKRYRSYRFNAHIRDVRWLVVVGFFVPYVLLSIHSVVQGSIDPSAMIAGQIYVFSILGSLLNLHVVVQKTEQAFADAAELTDILDLDPELKDPANPEQPRITEGLIEFKAVQFQYPKTSQAVFEDLSLIIQPGEKVGIVGHSGSGKSTLTRLLVRFIDINDGAITIDGQNITHITQDDLRRHIAFVPQEPLLFHRTIAENIGYGREHASQADIQQAAKLAYADEFIKNLPEAYDTFVGERGVKLSGGERQRVAIARAMLTDSPILILDEATSALDSKSEKLITKALDELMKQRTTLVIAHRLSTIKKLDRIIVMKAGKIVEDGSHSELLKQGGEYAELWSHQSGNFLED